MFMSLLYQVLIRFAALLVFAATCVRGVRDRSYRERLPERFDSRNNAARQPIWLHAVSVGECRRPRH
jgi:3-deoxy-D-manno-octulosonic-acid transferase